ncbi:MAG: glycosyltransferase family 2 protein, partial [Pseudomonadota bacterium]
MTTPSDALPSDLATPAANPYSPADDYAALSSELETTFEQLSGRRLRPSMGSITPLPMKQLKRRFKQIYQAVQADFQQTGIVTRAQEWLLDNRHIVEEALEAVHKHLPKRFLRELPGIAEHEKVSTHVEALAFELIELGQQPLDLSWLEKTVHQYQKRMPLTIGELWALPTAMGRVLIEQLADAAEQSNGGQQDEVSVATDRIAECITSLRVLNNCDWQSIFERLCVIEKMLTQDPAAAYSDMDFESRNNYRSRVEELARGSKLSEVEVTQRILEHCEQAKQPRKRHVGFALISGGWSDLTDTIGFRPSMRRRLLNICRRWPGPIYFGLTAMLSLIPTIALYLVLTGLNKPLALTALVTILTLIPLMGLATAMVNGLITWLLPPRRLARLAFERGIPTRFRSVVVVPVLFGSSDEVDTVFETLEKNYLGNEDPEIVYAVLSDLADAHEAETEKDQGILDRAAQHIEALNQRYGHSEYEQPFLFLNRKRQWNEAENRWMGWERKRGKLMEFNDLLAGDQTTSYSTTFGDLHTLDGVRYVITLDADTRMPPGAARSMIGTLAHPLSQAVINDQTGQLTHGYSIIQPRLEVDPETTRSTRFTHVFSGDVTLDLYTSAASDTYHDLFGHGIFTGKGIYDWHAIEQTLGNRIPENTLLSHDLLEGIHGTVGLATDIVLLEQYPPTVVSFMRRAHRWVRGDWQLLPWLMPQVPLADGRREANPLRKIHRWKIIDNLRRSIQPPVLLALFLIAWSGIMIGPAWAWTSLIAILIGAPLISDVFTLLTRCVTAPRFIGQFLRTAPMNLGRQFLFWIYNLILLPYQAWVMIDAITRTLWRIGVSRKHLLQWKAAAQVNQLFLARKGAWLLWRELWFSPVFALVTGAVVAALNPAALPAASPLLLLWLLAPEWVRRVDRSLKRPSDTLKARDENHLRLIGRRTWLFFDRFIGPDDSWLPPDNYQEEPRALLAHRTSPTNIGMALNAGLAAHDFGWIDSLSLLAWLRNITDTMARMPRFRGHWYNWYETQNLKPLNPTYVSTVDSGNLAAALLT